LSARFRAAGAEWTATAGSPAELLQLVGTFVLAQDARAGERRPRKRVPEVEARDIPAAERKLGRKWEELLEKQQAKKLDELIAECRKRIELLGRKPARNTKGAPAKRR
jgi:hypothetical protein